MIEININHIVKNDDFKNILDRFQLEINMSESVLNIEEQKIVSYLGNYDFYKDYRKE